MAFNPFSLPLAAGPTASKLGLDTEVNRVATELQNDRIAGDDQERVARIAADNAMQVQVDAVLAQAESIYGPLYADTAAGIAGTVEGDWFAVDNGDGTVTIWLHDVGGVASNPRTLATTAYLASANGAGAVGVSGGGSVEDALAARPSSASLAAVTGSSLVGSQQPGTGAVPATVGERLDDIPLTPEGYGALGGGADDSTAFTRLGAALLISSRRRVSLKAGETYRVLGFEVPDGTFIEGNGATIERGGPTAQPLVSTGVRCVIEDLHVDGRYGDGVASSSIREVGIGMDDDCSARRCTATRTYGHGIGNKSVAVKLEYYRILIEDCYAYNCGANPNPDGSGSGDGIGLVNCHDSKVVRSRGDNNARSGITSTTYNTATETADNALSTNPVFEECSAYGNAYGAALNQEHVTRPSFIRCRTDAGITFNNSEDAIVENPIAAAISGTGTAHNPIITNVSILNSARGHELISLTGNSPQVFGGTITTTFGSPTGSAVQILPADIKGQVRNIVVVGGNNGFRLNVSDFSGLSAGTAAGVGIIEGPSGSSRNFARNEMPEKRGGLIFGIASAAPTAGAWSRGDRLGNRQPAAGQPKGWLATASGTPGTWVSEGAL